MFDRFAAPPKSRPSRSGALICLSVAVHVAAALALTVMGMWPIDKLSPPDRQVVLATAFVPAPLQYEEPAPPTTSPPPKKRGRAGARRPSAPVRPTSNATDDATEEVDVSVFAHGGKAEDRASDAGGFGHGLDGSGSGFNPAVLPMKPLAPPPPPPAPKVVPARVLDGRRIAGNAQILPSPVIQASMARAGQDTLRVPVEMCLTSAGDVRSLDLIESSGYEGYDHAILSEMRRWRYEPYRAGGMPIPVCTVITFIYHMQ